MKKRRLSLFLFLPLFLLSCKNSEPTSSNYIVSLDIFKESDTVKILQLSDIHWSMATNHARQEAYLRVLIKKADPDIIISTGDQVLTGNQANFETLYNLFDSCLNSKDKPIYWSLTWGNHDRQGLYHPDFPSDVAMQYLSTKKYLYANSYEHHGLYLNVNDDVQGRGNAVINLTDGNKTIWQLWTLDSNSDLYNGLTYDYDYIRENQVDWFNKVAEYTKEGASKIPGLAFIHIPLFQTSYAYDAAHKEKATILTGDYGGELRESEWEGSPVYEEVEVKRASASYTGTKDGGFFKAAKKHGVRGIFYGHDHINDFWALYDDESYYDENNNLVNPNGYDDDILLAYATKTGDGLYYNKEIMGGNLITIHKDGAFNGREATSGTDFQHIYLSYEEALA